MGFVVEAIHLRKPKLMTNLEFFISQWHDEEKSTLSAIKGLPADISRLDYQPNTRARSAHKLLNHFLSHPESLYGCIDTGIVTEAVVDFKSVDEMTPYFNEKSAQLVSKLGSVSEEVWLTKNVDFVHNGQTFFSLPMYLMFWKFLFDMIHHRGQLSIYYRAMGVRNPSIYGPTAEDIEDMIAASQAAAQN